MRSTWGAVTSLNWPWIHDAMSKLYSAWTVIGFTLILMPSFFADRAFRPVEFHTQQFAGYTRKFATLHCYNIYTSNVAAITKWHHCDLMHSDEFTWAKETCIHAEKVDLFRIRGQNAKYKLLFVDFNAVVSVYSRCLDLLICISLCLFPHVNRVVKK